MTELETIERAKMYIDKLANGVNPLTDKKIPEDDTINNVRISRCLFFVSDILRQVIDSHRNQVNKGGKADRIPFSITHEELKNYQISDTPIPVSEITKRINELKNSPSMVKLKYSSITAFLIETHLLEQLQISDGKTAKRPTLQGQRLGITTEGTEYYVYGNY